jgi:Bacterial SH3 domain
VPRSLAVFIALLMFVVCANSWAQTEPNPPPAPPALPASAPEVLPTPLPAQANPPLPEPVVAPPNPTVLAPALPPSLPQAEPAALNEERLQVTAPYLEMRSGPGRGYPIFYVVERLQWVNVELRHTDWYRVRAERGQTGWVHRKELESTLTEAGGTKTFRDVLLDDFLHRRVEFGAAWGRFKRDPMLKLWLQVKLGDAVGAEVSIGQVQGVFSGSDFWHIGLTSEPWYDKRFSPFFSIGLGKFNNVPNAQLVNAVTVSGKLAQATLGLRWHLSERFTARLDATLYTAFLSDLRSTEYRSLTAGIGFFF